MKKKIVLGIETSCDDTSLCLLHFTPGKRSLESDILAHERFSQEKLLARWGGVVPEVAARNHLEKLAPLLKEVLEKSNVTLPEVDLIGVTTHPGLLGPLLTGINLAKTLSMRFQIPLVSVNHLFAHIEAISLTKDISYPFLALLVSGGHSLYFLVKDVGDFEVLGTTIDDAAGEALDKGGKLLGLDYPAGKMIDELAQSGDPMSFRFPIGLEKSQDATLSFSGIKSSLRLLLEKRQAIPEGQELHDLCASYLHTVVKALELKLHFAYQDAKKKTGNDNLPLVVGGGVASNSLLRKKLQASYSNCHFVAPTFCTDNGAMIANSAIIHEKEAIPYPESLNLDARGRYIHKNEKRPYENK